MKATIFQWVMTLFLSMGLSKMTAQIYQIPSAHDTVTETVKQFFRGDTVVFAIDSAYLLNKMQLKHYELLLSFKVKVSQQNANIQQILNDLVKSTNSNLARLETLNKDMRANADSASAIGVKLANATLENVKRANIALDSAQAKVLRSEVYLAKAEVHLKEANRLIEKEKKDRCWRNLKWAAVGTGVGAILGFIIKSSLK